jgi:hypothetical protein
MGLQFHLSLYRYSTYGLKCADYVHQSVELDLPWPTLVSAFCGPPKIMCSIGEPRATAKVGLQTASTYNAARSAQAVWDYPGYFTTLSN